MYWFSYSGELKCCNTEFSTMLRPKNRQKVRIFIFRGGLKFDMMWVRSSPISENSGFSSGIRTYQRNSLSTPPPLRFGQKSPKGVLLSEFLWFFSNYKKIIFLPFWQILFENSNWFFVLKESSGSYVNRIKPIFVLCEFPGGGFLGGRAIVGEKQCVCWFPAPITTPKRHTFR